MSDSIRRVSTIFTIDDNQHNQKLKSINQQYKLTQSEIKLAGERLKGFGNSTDDLKFKQAALEKQITTLREKSNLYTDSIEKATKKANENKSKLDELGKTKESLNKQYNEAVKVYGKESDQAKTLKAELDKVNEEYTEQERVVTKNVDAVNKYKSEMNKTEAQLAGVQVELNKTNAQLEKTSNKWLIASEKMNVASKAMKDTGKTMKDIGGSLNKYVTLPIAAMGTVAVAEAIKFESSFAGVQKTVDGTAEQMKKLEKGIIDMSRKIPATTHEISAVAEAAGQLGVQTDNVLDFTKVIIDLGESTNISGEEGAAAIAKFANITKMSQKDFDRFGATIVALGNNSATTEQDILNMSMRLAAAGSQAGMSDAKILGMAAALSSVGIEAEAGGSAMSKFMNMIQLSVETGNKNLGKFAKVAGMSAGEFKKAFQEDAAGALGAFLVGLQDTDRHGKSAVQILDEMGIKEVRLRDTLLRASGAGDLFNNTIEMGSKAWEENVALTEEANKRYATTESKLKIAKNEVMEAARSLGVELLPVIRDTLPVITDMVKTFANLPPETKKNIVQFGLLAAALGPVLTIGGALISGAGTLIGLGSTLAGVIGGAGGVTAATAGLGAAAATAGGAAGVGTLALGLGGVAAVALPVAGAIAVVGMAGYALHKGLTQEVVPSVDLFADHMVTVADVTKGSFSSMGESAIGTTVTISEETQKQIESYMGLSDNLQAITTEMYVGLTTNTDKATTQMVDATNQMADNIIAASNKQNVDVTAEYQKMFSSTTVLTQGQQQQILADVSAGNEERINKTNELRTELLGIYEDIKNQSGKITQDQQVRINEIMEEMKRQAVTSMSKNEAEQNVILNRLSGSNERITAEMVGNTIKQMEKQRKETVKTAGQQRDELVRQAEELRQLEGGKWSAKADEIIRQANKQYEETVSAAEKTKSEGIEKLEDAYGDLTNEVDTNTGEILTYWGKVKRWWNSWNPENKETKITTTYENRYKDVKVSSGGRYAYALGTSNSLGGMAMVHERGYEMIDLPAGSKVRNHLSSTQMAADIAQKTAESMTNKILSAFDTQKPVYLVMDKEKIGEALIPIIDKGIGFESERRGFALGGV